MKTKGGVKVVEADSGGPYRWTGGGYRTEYPG